MSPEAIPVTAAFRLMPRMVQPISSTPFLTANNPARHPHGIRRISRLVRGEMEGSDIKTKRFTVPMNGVYIVKAITAEANIPKRFLRNNRKQHSNNIIKPIMRRIYSIAVATAILSAWVCRARVPFGAFRRGEQFAGQQRHKHRG